MVKLVNYFNNWLNEIFDEFTYSVYLLSYDANSDISNGGAGCMRWLPTSNFVCSS